MIQVTPNRLLIAFIAAFVLTACKVSEKEIPTSTSSDKKEVKPDSSPSSNQSADVDLTVYVEAKYPDGNEAFIRFTMTPRYVKSDSLKALGVEKQDLFVLCDIDTSGTAHNIRMYEKPTDRSDFPYHQVMADKAMEIVKSMPPWKPAKLHGRKTLQKEVLIRIRVMIE